MIRQVVTYTTSSPEYIDLSSEISGRDATYNGWKVPVPRDCELQFTLDAARGMANDSILVLMAVKVHGALGPSVVCEKNRMSRTGTAGTVVVWTLSRSGAMTIWPGGVWSSLLAGLEFVYFVPTYNKSASFDSDATLTMVAVR